MNTDQYLNSIKTLNNIAFEKKPAFFCKNYKPHKTSNFNLSSNNFRDQHYLNSLNSSYFQHTPSRSNNFSEIQNETGNISDYGIAGLSIDPSYDQIIRDIRYRASDMPETQGSNINLIDQSKNLLYNGNYGGAVKYLLETNPAINNLNYNEEKDRNNNIINEKNFSRPNNIKILCIKNDDGTSNSFNNSFYNIGYPSNNTNHGNRGQDDLSKNVIINNNINNYNISYNNPV